MPNRTGTWCEHNIGADGATTDAASLVTEETLYSVQDVSTDGPTTIYNAPALLLGVYINTVLSAHTVVLTDAAATVITLPASLAAGTLLKFPGVKFASSLRIAPNASSTGSVVVLYRPV